MAKVRKGPGLRPQRQTQKLSPLESSLIKAGLAKTPQEARALAKKILSALKKLGVTVPEKGADNTRLESALKEFQKGQNIGQSGKLDAQTQAALKELGVFGQKERAPSLEDLSFGDVGLGQAGDLFGAGEAAGKQSVRGKLGLEVQFSSSRREQMGEAFKGVPTERGHALETKSAVARNKLRAPTQAENLKETMSALNDLGHPGEGSGKAQLESAVKSFQEARGLPVNGKLDPETLAMMQQEHGVFVARAQDEGEGNAPAGDEDREDADRGHAQYKAGEHDEGYYEIPSMTVQIRAAIDEIKRVEAAGAVRYSWDVTFHKPGVYGARQPADALFHLVVTDASPFDEVWERARKQIRSRLAIVEPDAVGPSEDDFRLALRRARFRD